MPKLPQPFFAARTSHGARTLLELGGECDAASLDALNEALTDAVEQAADEVVVDLAQTTFLDSLALGALTAAAKRVRACGRSFRVVRPSAPVEQDLDPVAGAAVAQLELEVDDVLEGGALAGAGAVADADEEAAPLAAAHPLDLLGERGGPWDALIRSSCKSIGFGTRPSLCTSDGIAHTLPSGADGPEGPPSFEILRAMGQPRRLRLATTQGGSA